MVKATLRFVGADLVLHLESPILFPESLMEQMIYDKEQDEYHIKPKYYPQLRKWLESNGHEIISEFNTEFKLEVPIKKKFTLREYQSEAFGAWEANRYRGVVVLPTGGGKTLIAIAGIYALKERTLVVVPTINLMDQWADKISEFLDYPRDLIALYGGGEKEIDEITITTYDSAALNFRRFADKFGLVVFDEVHHLPAPTYRRVAEGSIASHRLGLSATPERADQAHVELEELVGPIVYRLDPQKLSEEGYIAPFEHKVIYVSLSPEEKEEYDKNMSYYRGFLSTSKISFRSALDFEKKLIRRSFWDPYARKAVQAHRKARHIAFNAQEKLKAIEAIMRRHKKQRVIIFSEFIDVVNLISRTFILPKITSETKAAERRLILSAFASGEITKIVTGKVLDEGFDVSGASIGVIASGTSQKRQIIQRLGRLLRPEPGKKAILYELVTEGTVEESSSRRRSRAIKQSSQRSLENS